MKNYNLFFSLVFLLAVPTVFGQALQEDPCAGLLASSELIPNDPCANVSTATLGLLDGNVTSCGGGLFDDGIAWFTGDGSTATVDFTGLSANGVLHVFEAGTVANPCAGITNTWCSNVAGTANESLTFPTISGRNYFIRIQNEGTDATITGCLGVTFTAPIPGCTDPTALNYNPLATVADGSCSYPGADYVHPIAGGAGEFVGACLVNDCGPFTYTDDGGPGGDYSTNIGQPGFGGIYRVFCPDMAGNCMQVTFTSFVTEAGWDYMLVKDGPTQNSPEFAALHTATAYAGVNGMNGNLSGSMPATFTSTDASGCLTFRFYSDNSVPAAGWNATMQCVPCAGGPNGTDNNDCMTMTPLCSTYSLGGDASGPGLNSDGCSFGICPAGGENYSNWFTFTADNGGTLDISVVPNDPLDDYDFAVYGPNVSCAALGSPLRCSDAAAVGTTGTGGDTDLSEPASGNGQVATINATTGDTYILVIDEWSPNATGSGFDLNFTGTATLDCSVLPVELAEFNVEYYSDEHVAYLSWKTLSEINNDRFEIERSTDGVNFETIHEVKGAGTTTLETNYIVTDVDPIIGMNYYRLKQIDINGLYRYSEVKSLNILDDFYDILTFSPNPTTGQTEVIFNSYLKEKVQLQVLSIDGSTVVRTELSAVPGGNRFDLDLTEIEGNIFFVTITTSSKTYSGKVMKN
jgi:hypothetical protein